MKRILTISITALLFVMAVVMGLKNQQMVTINFLIAQSDLRLSTLLALVFSLAFTTASCIASYFYFTLKLKNHTLRKSNSKLQRELNDLCIKSDKD